MNETITNAITQGVSVVAVTVLTTIFGFISFKIKKYAKNYFNTDTKKAVANTTVNYIEQIFKDVHGKDKLEKAKEQFIKSLNEKGINITDENEIVILLEAAVNKMNAENIKNYINGIEVNVDKVDVFEDIEKELSQIESIGND